MPSQTTAFLRKQQTIQLNAKARLAAYWHKVGLDLDTSWRRVRPAATRTLSQAMHETALHAALFVDELMIATDQTAEPEMLVNPYAFLGSLPNTMPLDTAFEPAIYRTKQAIKNGYAFPLAKQAGLAYIMQTIGTALADLRRDIISVDTVQRPALTGYVRVVAPPACSRCIILAGKWFRWNEGFQRHPNCDCIHLPVTSEQWAVSEGWFADPYAYFNSVSERDQDRLFGRWGAQAIRDGADIYQVENQRRRGLTVSRKAVSKQTSTRLTPTDIYSLNLSREKTIQLLERNGYITGPQTAGGNLRGRFYEAYTTPISKPVQEGSKRARVLQARETGVRDPLDPATMTAAERRLAEAVYKREYARKYGYYPRSFGENSADKYSGLVGAKATRESLEQLDNQIAVIVGNIKPHQQSMLRLVEALGLDSDEFATGQAFREIEKKFAVFAKQREAHLAKLKVAKAAQKAAKASKTAKQAAEAEGARRLAGKPATKAASKGSKAAAASGAGAKTAAGSGGGKKPPGKPPAAAAAAGAPDGFEPPRYVQLAPGMPQPSRENPIPMVSNPFGYVWEPLTLTPARRKHVMYGDNTGGGHKRGLGRPGKTEFPEGFTDEQLDRVVYLVQRYGYLTRLEEDSVNFMGIVDEVLHLVAYSPKEGILVTTHAVRGEDVFVNSNGKRKEKLLRDIDRERFTLKYEI